MTLASTMLSPPPPSFEAYAAFFGGAKLSKISHSVSDYDENDANAFQNTTQCSTWV